MGKLILGLYGYFARHRGRMAFVLVVLTVALGLLVTRIHYKEDISDFLPLDGNQQSAMRLYQEISGADQIVALVGAQGRGGQGADADYIAEAADAFAQALGRDKLEVTSAADLGKVAGLASFVYDNIPYFLTEADYRRMDSLLAQPDYVARQLHDDMAALMLPSGGVLADNIGRDPLNLFTPVVEKLNAHSASARYELYGGHLFTPDMRNALLIIESPYGSSETEKNGELLNRLAAAAAGVKAKYGRIDIRFTGGPVIAVGNASQIKTDSAVTIVLAVALILVLLVFVFRSVRNILLIAASIAWGWFFALGCLSVVHSTVSLIVIGISSVIIGIAANYPLHLVAHLNHTPDVRRALGEVVAPLLVGNVTTIGAFLALVPLKSVALRDLGLFAAFLLIGTILFVCVFLPHFVKVSPARRAAFGRMAALRPENKPWAVGLMGALTVVFAVFSLKTSFDPDISHVNYMSEEQRQNVDYLSKMLDIDPHERTVYAVATGKTADEALASNDRVAKGLSALAAADGVRSVGATTRFLASREEQRRRLGLWEKFVRRHAATLEAALAMHGSRLGFSGDSFAGFYAILSRSYRPQGAAHFAPLTEGPLRATMCFDSRVGEYSVVTPITVEADKVAPVTEKVNEALRPCPSAYSFEIGRLNRSLAEGLSDNFNYIGLACSLIVFFFLWLSFGNLELAALSFLPMAVSWLWILGIMAILGIQFNIINIILATFIFGQGDDYTIFITEGCQYEYTYRRKMLASYKSSIIVSALIMFIGMGVLVLARHPALRSLGEVTVVGMLSVVVMAYVVPPLIFNWLTSKGGRLRNRPLTLKSLLMPRRCPQEPAAGMDMAYYRDYVRDAYHYCDTGIARAVRRALADPRLHVVSETDEEVVVGGGSYGAVALLMALARPGKRVVARCGGGDDATVCKNMACRIANNIRLEDEEDE